MYYILHIMTQADRTGAYRTYHTKSAAASELPKNVFEVAREYVFPI